MKLKLTALAAATLFAAAILAFGCGGGGEASFSPDPNVAGAPEGEAPGGEVPADGGGEGESAKQAEERDCFLDGFCYRRCASASECPGGFSCVMHVCTFDCQSDDECGPGGECNDGGLCEAVMGEEIPACMSDIECGDGRSCNADGECEAVAAPFGCLSDANCPAGQYCDETRSCELLPAGEVACADDDECFGNSFCGAGGTCMQECRTSAQCADEKACDGDGRCVAVGAPLKLVSFNFGGTAAPTFTSASYRIDRVAITPAGRNQVLTSARFRLINSAGF